MISVNDVSKRFGRVSALEHVSLRIGAGERVGLVGTNGSGKTTLIRAICGLLRVSGRIELDGIDVSRQPALALRALAYMPQVAPPLEAPVAELVRAYLALRGKSYELAERLAAQLGLRLADVARTRVRDLSGGMKQKLMGALALSCEAQILVCDEPTASLDAAARHAFFELVNARPSSSMLLLCSHRGDEIHHLVDRVIELRDGQIAHDESMSDGFPRTASGEDPRALSSRDSVTLRLGRAAR